MLEASRAYKQQMAQHLRNHSYCIVTIGAINQLAQQNAYVSGDTAYLSNNTLAFLGDSPTIRYATMEQDWFKADGSMFFPPRPQEVGFLYNQGIIATEIDDSIEISLGDEYDIKGLTIDFSNNYPTDFTISNGTVTYSYSGNDSYHFVCSDIFDNTSVITITPIAMVNGDGRLRIDLFYCGVGIQFTNQKLLSVQRTDSVSPIAADLPISDLRVSVENYDEAWDINNSASSINYLESGQQVEVSYGYEMNDGSITWMDGGVYLLKSWQTGNSEMSFEAQDRLSSLTETYYGGEYHANGISLYSLALLVLNDAGVDDDDYVLDTYLQNILVRNPLPAVTHAECLQIIANAGRCRLYIDRRGRICIDAAFELEIGTNVITVSSDNASPYSNLASVAEIGNPLTTYATMEEAFLKADSSATFLPRGQNYLTSGYVSASISNANGTFTANPSLTINIPAAVKYFGINIGFGSDSVKEFTISVPGGWSNTFTAETTFAEGAQSFTVDGGFPESNEYVLTFTKTKPNSRVHINGVSFGELTDYAFTKDNLTTDAIGTRNERTKQLDVVISNYADGTELQNIANIEMDLTDADEYTFYLSAPAHGFSAKVDDSTTIGIIDASAYFVTVNTSTLSGAHKVSLYGYSYIVSQDYYKRALNNYGKYEQWENPLVSDYSHAQDLSEWIGDYFLNNADYSIQYRGDPRIEAFDYAYLQNPYIENLLVQITSHTLTFTGALSGTAEARLAIESVGEE